LTLASPATPKPGVTPAKQAQISLLKKHKQSVIESLSYGDKVEFLLDCIVRYQKYKPDRMVKRLDFNRYV